MVKFLLKTDVEEEIYFGLENSQGVIRLDCYDSSGKKLNTLISVTKDGALYRWSLLPEVCKYFQVDKYHRIIIKYFKVGG